METSVVDGQTTEFARVYSSVVFTLLGLRNHDHLIIGALSPHPQEEAHTYR